MPTDAGFRTVNRTTDAHRDQRPQAIADADAPIMVLRGIYKSFGPVQALKNVTLQIRCGEIHAVVGENGAGKSTLISVAAGVLPADRGDLRYDGRDIAKPDAHSLRKAGVSVVSQHPTLAPDLTVLENLQLAAPHLASRDGFADAERLLRTVATERLLMPLHRRVADLNLAQRHVVEIARALATEPKVLFLDEPTEPFQEADIRKLFDLVKSLRADGVAVVYVSHRLHEVDELADRISVMRDAELLDSRPAGDISADEIITLIAGRPLGQMFPDKAALIGDTVLEVRGLSGPGFDKVDFVARAGEIVGLTGVEGEGQRQFLRALAGVGRRTSGTVDVRGRTPKGDSAAAMRRAGIGFVTDDRHAEGLFLTLSLRENFGIGAIDLISRFGVVDRAREFELSTDVASRLDVKTASLEAPTSTLSGGNQQKVLIGREFAAAPKVLLVDEPTKGVDVGARSEIYQRLRAMADEGIAVVVCSSDGIEHEGLCDRVAVFARGHIVKELTGSDITDTSITEANLTARVARADTHTAGARRSWQRRVLASDHFPAVVLAVLAALVVGATTGINEFFVSAYNVGNILAFLAIVTFISMGQLLTILVGRIDLSVGPLAGCVVVVASFWMPRGAPLFEVSLGAAAILACAAGFGFVQGWLVTALRLPAIIVTLASFIGLQGFSLILRPEGGEPITRVIKTVANYKLAGIPSAMILALIVVAGLEWMLYRSATGRTLRAVGSSPTTAERLGIKADRAVLAAFVLCGLLTGIGGLLLAGQVGRGSPVTGIDYTLISITAVVLGGASVAGGRGSFLATLMGGALVQTISSASAFMNSDSAVRWTILGGVTLLAATFFSIARRNRPPQS